MGKPMDFRGATRRIAAREQVPLAAEVGGRDTEAEVVEHIPVPAPYVSPDRQRALQDRPSVSGRIVRRDPETGEITAIGRFVRERVGRQYVTRWEDEVPS